MKSPFCNYSQVVVEIKNSSGLGCFAYEQPLVTSTPLPRIAFKVVICHKGYSHRFSGKKADYAPFPP